MEIMDRLLYIMDYGKTSELILDLEIKFWHKWYSFLALTIGHTCQETERMEVEKKEDIERRNVVSLNLKTERLKYS